MHSPLCIRIVQATTGDLVYAGNPVWDIGTCSTVLDCVDRQNPQVRYPPMRLKQRIVIGTEMSWCPLTMNRGVEHAAEVGAVTAPHCTPKPTGDVLTGP